MDPGDPTNAPSSALDAETIVEDPDGRRLMPEDIDEAGLTPGTRLGRYVVLEAIGSGGMGLVLAAYDPELNRKVALKLMRPTKRDRRREKRGKAGRLLKEAQALAKLAHPNVITVYDVGTWEDRVFVAMELVEGSTLKGWVAASKRRFDEVLSVFVPAGRGLAAAHAAGLIHRDFKPDNVLIGDDGRVRVMDFGLAEPAPGTDTDTGSLQSMDLIEAAPAAAIAVLAPGAAAARDMVSPLLSQTGSVMGTPAYMAPEQHAGKVTDPRSDQYSFCVALYQALYGALPFDGSSMTALIEQKEAGQVPEPTGSGVPGWVRKAVLRGLAPDRNERWPSMEELLTELENDPRVARRKWLGIAGAVVLATGSLGGVVYLRTQRPAVCQGAQDELAEVWNDERKQAAAAGLVASAVPGTDPAWLQEGWTKIETVLDDYGRAWVDMSTDACEATYVRVEQSARLLGQRRDCLDLRRAEIDALAEILGEADATVAPLALEAASSLSPLSRCADSEALAAAVDPPSSDQTQADVEKLRRALSRAKMLDATGRSLEAVALAEQLLAEASAMGYAPAEAEARFRLGQIKASLAEAAAAEEHLGEAHYQASSVKHDTIAATAASALVRVVGIDLARRDEGLGWSRHADAAFKRIGLRGVDEALLRHRVGSIHAANGRWAEADEALEQAKELYEEQPRQGLALSRVLRDLAEVRVGQGRFDDADGLLDHATTLAEQTAGASHPELAAVLAARGRVDDARRKGTTAREHYAAGQALLERTVGPNSPLVADVLQDLARSHQRDGQTAAAITAQMRALTVLETALGEHPRVAAARFSLGVMRLDAGRRDDARGDFEGALAMWESTRGKDHPDLAYSLTRLAALDLDDGQPKRAVERLERALKVRGRKGLAPTLLADTQFALAKALHVSGEDRTRAQELARKARKTFEDAGPSAASSMTTVDHWLTEIDSDPDPDPDEDR